MSNATDTLFKSISNGLWPNGSAPPNVSDALDALAAALNSQAGKPETPPVSLIYRPNGPASGNIYSDPWILANKILEASVPVDVYVDCTLLSPAPWPVDYFLPNVRWHANPVTSAPAIIQLVKGSNPFFGGTPTDGKFWFPVELDAVGIVLGDSLPDTMVEVGQIFGDRFTMKNGAYIQRPNNTAPQALIITGNPVFNLDIENCLSPFPNLADSTASNVQYFGNVATTLVVLVTVTGPEFLLPPFFGQENRILQIRYDASVPVAQVIPQPNWAGAFTPIAIDGSASGAPYQTFVFQPNGTAGPNVLTSEAALAAATQALNGAAYSIVIDFSHTVPAPGTYVVQTVGKWNLGPNGTWDDGGLGYAFSFENETILPYPPAKLLGALTWQTKQIADVCSPASPQHFTTEFRNATIALSYNSGALINTKAGTAAIVFADSASSRRAGGTGFPFNASGGFLNFYANDFSFIDANSVEKTLTGAAFIYVGSPSVVIDPSMYPLVVVQGLFVDLFGGGPGTIPAGGDAIGALMYSGNELFTSNGAAWVPAIAAAGTTYAPGVPANWAGAAPSQVNAAIDRLAAAVRGLLGAPIP
jgi:hypothetical protein